MKFSTCIAACAVSIAFVTTGCRYDKASGEGLADSESAEVDTNDALDINPDLDVSSEDIPSDAQGGALSELTDANGAGGSFKDRGYALCTDVSFAPVYFGFDATTIAPAELAKVEAVAHHLAENPDRVVTIEGNCDERGSNEYNLSLGDDRAIIIGNFLAQNGIARDRMETVSRGETNPAVEGSGEAAWSQNRRGEFIIWKK